MTERFAAMLAWWGWEQGDPMPLWREVHGRLGQAAMEGYQAEQERSGLAPATAWQSAGIRSYIAGPLAHD
jgi:hypothetical protein